jgi:hypothetical protein
MAMSTPAAGGTEFNLKVSAEERAELLRLLQRELGDTRVEVHRTHTPAYRDQVLHQENLVRALLEKLQKLQA